MGKSNIHELIDKRWSPRSFSEKPVETEKLERMFEAARRSPSSFNEQPWRFLVGMKGKGDTWNKIFNSLTESNQEWAKTAPVLILIVAKTAFSKNDKPNKHSFYDAGQSAAYLTLQALTDGLYVHQMAGYFADKAKELFLISQGFEPITAVALGYKGDPENLPLSYKETENQRIIRKELSEIVFTEWGKPLLFG